MDLNLKPLKWDWPPVTSGDTYPATQITETDSVTDLVRVRVSVKDSAGVVLLDLDSDDEGITLTSTSAGAWDFTIDEIDATVTEAIDPGYYAYDLETTDDAGWVRTEFSGVWQILPQTTS